MDKSMDMEISLEMMTVEIVRFVLRNMVMDILWNIYGKSWLVVVNSGLRSSTYEQTMDNLWIIYG